MMWFEPRHRPRTKSRNLNLITFASHGGRFYEVRETKAGFEVHVIRVEGRILDDVHVAPSRRAAIAWANRHVAENKPLLVGEAPPPIATAPLPAPRHAVRKTPRPTLTDAFRQLRAAASEVRHG